MKHNIYSTQYKNAGKYKKSVFFKFKEYNKDGFIDLFNSDINNNVPVAITGSVNSGLFWQIGGAGLNGSLEKYLSRKVDSKGLNALKEANKKLQKEKPKTAAEAYGTITKVDFNFPDNDAKIKKILYSASPNLDGKNQEQAKSEMIAFGKKFRIQLGEKKVKSLYLPLFSGGIYSGEHNKKDIAEWMMEGWLSAEKENTEIESVGVYLTDINLQNAVFAPEKSTQEPNNSKHPIKNNQKLKKPASSKLFLTRKNLDSIEDCDLNPDTSNKQKFYYAEFGGLKFTEKDSAVKASNDSNSKSASKDVTKIFQNNDVDLFMSSFRGCVFEDIDFRAVKNFETIGFYNCEFKGCAFTSEQSIELLRNLGEKINLPSDFTIKKISPSPGPNPNNASAVEVRGSKKTTMGK